jgi:carboxylesterase type B
MLFFICCLLLSLRYALAQSIDAALPTLQFGSSCGVITGQWITLSNNKTVAFFIGIKYASLIQRWETAVPVSPCNANPYNATSYAACIQPNGEGTEDCLHVNVFIPSEIYFGPKTSRLPIMAYIHGGGLMSGSGDYSHLEYFVSNTQTIGVTINYRLNIFGFLSLKELSLENGQKTGNFVSGNYGIQDQQLALRFIKSISTYIFGDESRITVAGQSSGGTSIFALLSSPASVGLFSAAISLSGSPNITISMDSAENQNVNIPASLNCNNANYSLVLSCLRSKSVSELLAAIPDSWNTPGIFGVTNKIGGMDYAGLVIVDGVTLTMPFDKAMEVGLVDVDMIVGNMGQEPDNGPDLKVQNFTDEEWQNWLDSYFSAWPANTSSTLYNLYSNSSLLDRQLAYDEITTDYGILCPTVEIAINAKKGNYKSNLYVYVNNFALYNGVPHTGYTANWAFHTIDLQAAFNDYCCGYVPVSQDLLQQTFLQSVWSQLMETGNLIPSESANWKSIEDIAGFPNHYNVMVISDPYKPPDFRASQVVVDYKANTCQTLLQLGFNKGYWWCD